LTQNFCSSKWIWTYQAMQFESRFNCKLA
jgi:hypothetical protein